MLLVILSVADSGGTKWVAGFVSLDVEKPGGKTPIAGKGAIAGNETEEDRSLVADGGGWSDFCVVWKILAGMD